MPGSRSNTPPPDDADVLLPRRTDTDRVNGFGQPIGAELPNWMPRPLPSAAQMLGRYCRLELLDLDRHIQDLFDAYAEDPSGRLWTYLPFGPFETVEHYRALMRFLCQGEQAIFQCFAIIDLARGTAVGTSSYMRADLDAGAIEVGGVTFSPHLQRSRVATEAMFLMMSRIFDEHGYRRYEWKCDALNAASRRAARRLGFQFEGIFRQLMVYKGRTRDTAWYSVIDRDWPALRAAFVGWLAPSNFDEHGIQRERLAHSPLG